MIGLKRMKTAMVGALLASLAAIPQPSAQSSAPNDLEIAHIAYVAGTIDIRYAHLALAISKNPKVREFAETMLRDHTAVNDQALALVKKLNIAPQDNATSQDLLKKSDALVAEMRALDGAAFDRRYAANELAYHQFVNGAVEKLLIPSAKNAELKSLLQNALKTFKAHEAHAAMMVQDVK